MPWSNPCLIERICWTFLWGATTSSKFFACRWKIMFLFTILSIWIVSFISLMCKVTSFIKIRWWSISLHKRSVQLTRCYLQLFVCLCKYWIWHLVSARFLFRSETLSVFTRLVLLVQSCFNDLYFCLSLCIDASNFVALPVTWSGLFRLKISLSIFSSKVFSICSNTSLLADFFSANFFGEIAKLFFRSARTSVNNSDLNNWKPINLLA